MITDWQAVAAEWGQFLWSKSAHSKSCYF